MDSARRKSSTTSQHRGSLTEHFYSRRTSSTRHNSLIPNVQRRASLQTYDKQFSVYDPKFLISLLKDKQLKETFFVYAAKKFSEEIVSFVADYLEIEELAVHYLLEKTGEMKGFLESKVVLLFEAYFGEGAVNELNIEDSLRTPIYTMKPALLTTLDFSEIILQLRPVFLHISELIQSNCLIPFQTEMTLMKELIVTSKKVYQKRVVIVGGGYTGIMAAQYLDTLDEFQVILIDRKSVFEHLPGLVKVTVDPMQYEKLTIKYEEVIKYGCFIQASVSQITSDTVCIGNVPISYDYLVIATGSSYACPIGLSNATNSFQINSLRTNYSKLLQAENVLVIGGGKIGVQIAAEVKERFPHKKVTIVSKDERLVMHQHPSTSKLVKSLVEEMGIHVVLGETVVEYNAILKRYITKERQSFEGDVVYFAMGSTPNTANLHTLEPSVLDSNGVIMCNQYLQVENYENMFCGGDLSSQTKRKSVLTAIRDGTLIAKNIVKHSSKEKLLSNTSNMYAYGDSDYNGITLGRSRGVYVFENYLLRKFGLVRHHVGSKAIDSQEQLENFVMCVLGGKHSKKMEVYLQSSGKKKDVGETAKIRTKKFSYDYAANTSFIAL